MFAGLRWRPGFRRRVCARWAFKNGSSPSVSGSGLFNHPHPSAEISRGPDHGAEGFYVHTDRVGSRRCAGWDGGTSVGCRIGQGQVAISSLSWISPVLGFLAKEIENRDQPIACDIIIIFTIITVNNGGCYLFCVCMLQALC